MNRHYVVLLLWLLAAGPGPAWTQDAVDLVILHQNDTHGTLYPFRTDEGAEFGGIARLATLVSRIRAEMHGRVLLLHGGDILSRGCPLTVHYGGEADLAAMDRIGYDVLTPGNGDFYFGVANLVGLASLARLDFVHANARYRRTGAAIFPPYVVKQVGDVKVGILGLGAVREDHPAGWTLTVDDPVALARRYVPQLRQETDLVVVLSHLGLRADSALAVAVPQIDLIVGGHSHSLLQTPSRIARPAGRGEVVIAQAGDQGQYLGRLDVHLVKEAGRFGLARVDGRLVPVDTTIEPDPEIGALLNRYAAPLEEVVCVAEAALANPASGATPLGARVMQAVCAETRAELALLDRGAVHDSLEAGDVTLAEVERLHPWRNRVLLLSLTGRQIGQVLGSTQALAADCGNGESAPEAQGLQIGGAPVDSARVYVVAAGEYLVWNTPLLRDLPADDTGRRIDTILHRHWRRLGVLR